VLSGHPSVEPIGRSGASQGHERRRRDSIVFAAWGLHRIYI
jgi:hypothetical protein